MTDGHPTHPTRGEDTSASEPDPTYCPLFDHFFDVPGGRVDEEAQAHFATCRSCREDLRFVTMIRASMMGEDVTVPPEVQERALARLFEHIEKERQRPKLWRIMKEWRHRVR